MKPPETVPDRGISNGEVDGSARGSPDDELVRFLIGISFGDDSGDDGERLGLWNTGGRMFGDVGGVGEVEYGDPTVKIALFGVWRSGGDGEEAALLVLGGDWLQR